MYTSVSIWTRTIWLREGGHTRILLSEKDALTNFWGETMRTSQGHRTEWWLSDEVDPCQTRDPT